MPKKKRQVRSFLWLIGFYRKFIPQFADISVCLTDLTTKFAPQRVKRSEENQVALDKLKGEICSKHVLRSPDFTCKFLLKTVASDVGLGSALEQDLRTISTRIFLLVKS